MQEKFIFLRNDDIRESLDPSLIRLLEICVKRGIPISLAVEPRNVTHAVADWLLSQQKQNPNLIEIIQHGYDHSIKYEKLIRGKLRKGEFGGNRRYSDQRDDLASGIAIMNDFFASNWTRVISFPFGAFNTDTLKAVKHLGYVGLSSSVSFGFKHRIKNYVARMLRLNFVLSSRVSYHLAQRPIFRISEVDVSVNVIRKYISETKAIHYSVDEVLNRVQESSMHTSAIGVLLHHRFHDEYMEEFSLLLDELIKRGYRFKLLSEFL